MANNSNAQYKLIVSFKLKIPQYDREFISIDPGAVCDALVDLREKYDHLGIGSNGYIRFYKSLKNEGRTKTSRIPESEISESQLVAAAKNYLLGWCPKTKYQILMGVSA